jgi:cytochrome b-561
MPDWFLMWGYGFLKLTPSWLSFDLLGLHFSAEFIGGLLLPGIIFAAVALWPFIDYEADPIHFTADPLDRPFQTAVGVAAVVFIMLASIAGMDIIVADVLGMTTAALRPYFIGSLVFGPLIAGLVVYAGLGGFGDNTDEEQSDEEAGESTDRADTTSEGDDQ